MIRVLKLLLYLIILLTIIGCGQNSVDKDKSYADPIRTITDVYGNSAALPDDPRVVSGYGSFSECWLLSGGKLVGVTDDAITERKLDIPGDVSIIGTVKEINLEKIVSLAPDYVILSADISAHASLENSLKDMNIQYGYFRVDNFNDYSELMRQFCNINGGEELYAENVMKVEFIINDIKNNIPDNDEISYLLMRVYSTGIKVKNDNIADDILKDIGGISIADRVPSLLTDLSVEEVIKADPDHIFVITMGDETSGRDYFIKNIISDPAWSSLSAIKNGNYHILPKELFHYKPNRRWGESYEYLARILYPEVYNDN